MFFRFVLFTFLVIPLSGCSDPRSEQEKAQGRILLQFSKEMKKKNLYTLGLGGGCSKEEKKINLISMTFEYREVMDIKSARELIVESTNTLLELISNHPKHQEYFIKEDPSIIYISILGKISESILNNNIEVVKIINGEIYYNIENKKEKFPPYTMVHKETFEEAHAILAKPNTIRERRVDCSTKDE